jgi:hypothetical protein
MSGAAKRKGALNNVEAMQEGSACTPLTFNNQRTEGGEITTGASHAAVESTSLTGFTPPR